MFAPFAGYLSLLLAAEPTFEVYMKAVCSLFIAVSLLSPLTVHGQAPEPASTPIKVSSGVMAGLAVSQPKPNLAPNTALGTIVLSVRIDKTGHVQDPKVVTSKSQELSDAYVDAVKRWRYRPYLLNGEPVDVQTTITVNMNAAAPAHGS